MTITIPTESAHWYTPSGEPRHDANLRTARREKLLPSVTAICKLFPNDGLKSWLRGQDVLAAATQPRLATESDDQWVERVIASADEESLKARTVGTTRHAICEQFNRGELKVAQWDAKDLAHCQPYFDWFTKSVRKVRHTERIVVNQELGYAGTLDLDCMLHTENLVGIITPVGIKLWAGLRAIIDIKNRKKLAVFPNDVQQLAAYAHCNDCSADKLISIILGTERQEILVHEWSPEDVSKAWANFQLCFALWKASRNYDPLQP